MMLDILSEIDGRRPTDSKLALDAMAAQHRRLGQAQRCSRVGGLGLEGRRNANLRGMGLIANMPFRFRKVTLSFSPARPSSPTLVAVVG
jgi:hypothetical protein